jgi:hypothetical protein
MPNPVAYNATTPPSGGFQRATITYGLSGSNYGANSPGGLTYYNSLPTSSAWVIISDSYTLGLSTQGNAKPVMWSTGSASTGSLIRLINGLPSMTSSFTDYYSAVNWLQSTNKYFLLNNGYENIVTDGLVLNLDAGWWNSYPTIGTTWTDLSGNNNNGTLINGPTFSSANSGSIVFDGVDDNVQRNALNVGNNFTVCVWAYPLATERQTLVGGSYNYYDSSTTEGFLFNIGNNGTDLFLSLGTDRQYRVSSNGYVSANTWFCASTTFDGTTIKIYYNGVETTYQLTGGTPFTITYNTRPFVIGSWLANGDEFRGNIAVTQLYNRALTTAEILQNYNAQKGRFGL